MLFSWLLQSILAALPVFVADGSAPAEPAHERREVAPGEKVVIKLPLRRIVFVKAFNRKDALLWTAEYGDGRLLRKVVAGDGAVERVAELKPTSKPGTLCLSALAPGDAYFTVIDAEGKKGTISVTVERTIVVPLGQVRFLGAFSGQPLRSICTQDNVVLMTTVPGTFMVVALRGHEVGTTDLGLRDENGTVESVHVVVRREPKP